MKTYIIELEVDDNVTTADIEAAVQDMTDNSLNTKEAYYIVKEE